MSFPLDRRSVLKAGAVLGAGLGLSCLGRSAAAFETAAGAPHAEKLGWRLGCQAWSFNRYTFFEAVDKTAGLGLHCINKTGGDAHDVPWGTGINNVRGLLAEILRQGIKAVFSIEYEYNWDHSLPEIAQSVAYFDKVSAQLGG